MFSRKSCFTSKVDWVFRRSSFIRTSLCVFIGFHINLGLRKSVCTNFVALRALYNYEVFMGATVPCADYLCYIGGTTVDLNNFLCPCLPQIHPSKHRSMTTTIVSLSFLCCPPLDLEIKCLSFYLCVFATVFLLLLHSSVKCFLNVNGVTSTEQLGY